MVELDRLRSEDGQLVLMVDDAHLLDNSSAMLLFHQAAEQIQGMLGVHRQLDKLLYQSATQIGGVEFESIFNPSRRSGSPPSLDPMPSTTTRPSSARRR